MNKAVEKIYGDYAVARLSGAFSEMGSWPLVLPYLKGRKVLDIGCSDGLYLRHLSKQSIGIEQIQKLADRARERGLHVQACDVMEGLRGQQDESFDGVLYSHVMEHISAPIDSLMEINRILRPEGTLILGLPIENCFIRHILSHDYFDGTHIYSFTVRNAKKLLAVTGFDVKRVIYHLPKFRGHFGYRLNLIWNVIPFPLKGYWSMAYWIYATKKDRVSR